MHYHASNYRLLSKSGMLPNTAFLLIQFLQFASSKLASGILAPSASLLSVCQSVKSVATFLLFLYYENENLSAVAVLFNETDYLLFSQGLWHSMEKTVGLDC